MSRHGHRFYVAELPPPGAALALPRETARQVARVLRLRPGDAVTLFTGDGFDVPATIESMQGESITVRLGQPVPGRPLPCPPIALAQSLLKHDHFELVIQKATELGVQWIVPLLAQRCVVAVKPEAVSGRLDRWRRIAIEAAEQCGRASLPAIEPPRRLDEIEATIGSYRAILLWEGAEAQPLAALELEPETPVLLLVGPEGGWTPGEVERLRAAGAELASLGPLVLRSETAALAAIAQAQALATRHGPVAVPPAEEPRPARPVSSGERR
ncbi:16S rRNA (uracil(1498)-N(3))-methyltransferase [Thermomicrobiaceae bacterium CFH 74404]|uniref:Ribosomal RNA small subunit methyltransferase E n=1 Tax=Thermalbibacter longus TaxID=2951981 RepID=A0AA41WDY2_9BACT|nr:16S rRNA (uracil(1498)-N(3))-methyltransferase [Thermalbibacter longus]MCM8748265.1 16S rRNA (uracil(1498)-N(3))-methyltransferase [Thermalbibacter longus]